MATVTKTNRAQGCTLSSGATPWFDDFNGLPTNSAITSAFFLSAIPSPQARSYGDRDSLDTCHIRHIPLLQPQDERSKGKGCWAGAIGGLIEEGWEVIFPDGSGRKDGAAAAMVASGEAGQPDKTATDAEKAAIALAIRNAGTTSFILTDSQAALQGIMNLCKGAPPLSGIKAEIKEALKQRLEGHDTAISWIRSHIGILGNECADALASFMSIRGEIAGEAETATEGGVRQESKAIRVGWRQTPGFGKRRTEWHRHASSA